MRFSSASLLLSLPLLAVAEGPDYVAQFQSQFQQYLGQAQEYVNKFSEKVPNPNKHDPVGAAEAKVGEMKMHTLTLDNWNSTLLEPVTPETTEPEIWWVLSTGGNKTCYGGCDNIEKAFNQTAAKLALLPSGPHVGMLNCEKQPVLCAAWSAPPGYLYVFEMLPRPAPVDIYTKRLNATTISTEEFETLYQEGHRSFGRLLGGYFHPYDGVIAQNQLTMPVGYVIWAFGLVPSWAIMIAISMFSRTMMGNRMQGQQGGARPAGAGQ